MYQRVEKIVIKYVHTPEARVVPEASFADDLGLDSLDTIELIMDVEDEFGVDILDQNGEKLKTMKDVLDRLRARLPGNK